MARKLQLSWMKNYNYPSQFTAINLWRSWHYLSIKFNKPTYFGLLKLNTVTKSPCTAVYGRYNFDKLYRTCPSYRRGQLDESIKNPHKTYLHRQFSAQINTNNKSICCCALNFVTYLCSFFEHVLKHRFRDRERHVESSPFTWYTVLRESWVMLVPSHHDCEVEEWRKGGKVEFWDGRMAEWRNGRMVEWRNGGMVEWWNDRTAKKPKS